VFATTFGSRFASAADRLSAAAATVSAVSALRTTRRARWTRVLSSIGTGGRPIGFFPAAINAVYRSSLA